MISKAYLICLLVSAALFVELAESRRIRGERAQGRGQGRGQGQGRWQRPTTTEHPQVGQPLSYNREGNPQYYIPVSMT